MWLDISFSNPCLIDALSPSLSSPVSHLKSSQPYRSGISNRCPVAVTQESKVHGSTPERGWARAVLQRTGCRSLGWVTSQAGKSWLGSCLSGESCSSETKLGQVSLRPLLRVSGFRKKPKVRHLTQQVSSWARTRTLGFLSSSITCDIKATEMESQTPSPEHSVPRALGGCCKGQRTLSDAATVLSPVVKVDNEVRRGWAAPRRPLETTTGWE